MNWGVQFPIQTNEPVKAQIINVFLTLLEAPYPMQRIDVCRENMSLSAHKATKSQHEPLCVPSALKGRDTGNFLP